MATDHDYYMRNRDRFREIFHQYYVDHAEDIRARKHAYYEANKERIKARNKESHRLKRANERLMRSVLQNGRRLVLQDYFGPWEKWRDRLRDAGTPKSLGWPDCELCGKKHFGNPLPEYHRLCDECWSGLLLWLMEQAPKEETERLAWALQQVSEMSAKGMASLLSMARQANNELDQRRLKWQK